MEQERYDTVQDLVKAKSPLAKAILDDEATRLQSVNRSRVYLSKKWAREDRTPYWVWAIGWAAFGMLLCLSILSSGPTVLDMIKGIAL